MGAAGSISKSFGSSEDSFTTRRKFRETGGEESVKLKLGQMPRHRHSIPLVTTDNTYSDAGLGTNAPYFDYRNREDVLTKIAMEEASQGVGPQGNNEPHNNMPPYISLYFCKKG